METNDDWDKMEDVLLMKFQQHPDLRDTLMKTGNADIIHDDEHEEFWGSGKTGQGGNELGKALVRVREKLRAEIADGRGVR